MCLLFTGRVLHEGINEYLPLTTDKITDILAHSTDTWSLYENAPLLSKNPMVKSNEAFDAWLLEYNRCMVHQGMPDNCFVSAADFEEAQKQLKPNIRPLVDED